MQSDLQRLNDRVTAVLGFSELLLEGAYGVLEPRQEEILQHVIQAASDIKDMIRSDSGAFSFD